MADTAYADDVDPRTAAAAWRKTHATAMERFRVAEAATADQARRELEDIKFAARRGRWKADDLNARKGLPSTNGLIGARPCFTIDKLRQPIQMLENQQRQANFAVNVHPKRGTATAKTAGVVQGIYRDIQVESRADQIARFWAYSRALKCGRGYYRVQKVYALEDPASDDPARFDQKLVISRILRQGGVLLDPFAQEPDWSDGEWGFESDWVPWDRYQREHPRAKLSAMDDGELSMLGNSAPGWIKGERESRAVLEANYWRVEFDAAETLTGPDGQSRVIHRRTVWCCKMNAAEITDETEWDGKYIPIIPVVWNEDYIDGERIWEGIIAPVKDSQRVYDYEVSTFVETIATAPKSPWLVESGQIEKFKSWWDQANVRNFPYLPYSAVSSAGKDIGPPQRNFAEPPVQAIAAAIHQADADINAQIGFFDPSRGNLSQGERSGKALLALQKQSEAGNAGGLDNLAQISMTYEAKVVLDLIPKVYDRPGRVARMLGVDDEPSSVMLGAPFTQGPDGQPQAVPPGMMPPEDAEHYDLADAAHDATVTIGKSHTTARDEAADTIGQILQAEPQLLMLIGDLYFKNLDGPGMQEISERMKKMLPPQLQEQDKTGTPDPAQMQQQLAAMQQQIQQLQPLADANQAKLMQTQAETASKEKIAAAEQETKREIERIKAQMTVEIERMRALAATQAAAGKAQSEVARTAMQEQGETERQRVDHLHEVGVGASKLHAAEHLAHTQHGHDMTTAAFDVANRPEPEIAAS